VTNFEILGPTYIFGTAKYRNFVFSTCVSHHTTNYSWSWRVQVTWSDFAI